MSAFRVGQKVVCIATPWGWRNIDHRMTLAQRLRTLFSRHPKLNGIYTVKRVWAQHLASTDFLKLEGFGRIYKSTYFRPLVYPSQSLEHDVAKFQGIARHVRAPEKERA